MSAGVVGVVVGVIAVVAYVAAAMGVATKVPLLAYTTSLACFGLVHVLVELRYVERRFFERLPPRLWRWSALCIASVVVLRALRVAGVEIDIIPAELGLVAGLVVVGAIVAGSVGAGVFGIIVAVGLVVGAAVAPLETLLVLAVGHNLTPWGFIVERASPARRPVVAVVAGLVFVGAPALVASGVVADALGVNVDVVARFASAGSIESHFGVYLWPRLVEGESAVALFSAAVCAQLLHYGAVIIWLPLQAVSSDEGFVSVKVVGGHVSTAVAIAAVVVAIVAVVGLVAHFAADFAGARGVYGIVAAVHAWIELPVLLAALGARRAVATSSAG